MAFFEKPIVEFTDQELLDRQNNIHPEYAALLSLEFQRRLVKENVESSKRFARWSLGLAIVAVLISFAIGAIQIRLAYIQATPIYNNIAKEEKQALSYCLENSESDWMLANGSTTTCKSILRKSVLFLEQDDIFELLLISTSSKKLLF